MKKSFTVQKDQEGQRLDVFLSNRIPKKTRSNIQKNIKKGKVSIDDTVQKKTGYFLKFGNVVTITFPNTKTTEGTIKPKRLDISFVYKDAELAVVDKPIGMTVHPGTGERNSTLVNGLLYAIKDFKNVGSPPAYGLIHRIDKETSGLVMAALTDEAHWFYSRQFEERNVAKSYICIVNGDFNTLLQGKKKILITNYIGRHPKKRRKMAVVSERKGRFASTTFQHIAKINHQRLGDLSLILAQIHTGRTHQIRVHLAHAGFPILGDVLYGKFVYKRMMLHALSICINRISGNRDCFSSEIPSDFLELFPQPNMVAKIKHISLS